MKLQRKSTSHKGENGKVIIVGGNEYYHGAPILCALGAEQSGADLIYPFVPNCHKQITKRASLNFIVQHFAEDFLTEKDAPMIIEFCQKIGQSDLATLVIGTGLDQKKETQKALLEILENVNLPMVIDAGALKIVKDLTNQKQSRIITPHQGEFWEITGELATENSVMEWSKKLNCIILCKGETDIIAAPNGKKFLNSTGNAKMTVGGTGDVLSGLIGGLLAQGLQAFDAAKWGAEILGKCGDELAKEKFSFTAEEITQKIPYVMGS